MLNRIISVATRGLIGATMVTAVLAAGAEQASAANAEPVGAAAVDPALRDGAGFYPRAIRLHHNGVANGRVLASLVTFTGSPPDGIGAIYESTNDGESFTQVGTVADPMAADGRGLCCATLFELPRQVGAMPAGTLLWAASVGASARPMSLRIWKSNDIGRTWSYLSSCAVAANTRGLWEPEFSIAADGRLVCHYADETDARHSQKLMKVRSSDGVTWTDRSASVASTTAGHRPGMPVVRRLPDGSYVMIYEICGVGGQYDCAVHWRGSADGWNWGTASSLGLRPTTLDGKYFAHAPTVAWAPSVGNRNGKLLLVGQILQNRDGSLAADNGRTILVNTENAHGNWYEIPAPVEVTNPFNNFCPNYSSPLLPSVDGSRVLELASDYDGTVCKTYFDTGSAIGTQTAAGVVAGATYRLVSAQSRHCLDVAAGSTQVGANVQQWTCNGLSPQNWLLTDRGGGRFALKAQNSGYCLDVMSGSSSPGANVRQWYCNSSAAQDWQVVNVGRGYYQLKSRASGHCLDVAGGSTQPGANVQQWTCNNLQPQIWRFERR